MKKSSSLIFFYLLIASAKSLPADEAFRFVKSIPLPGVEGRIDHLAVDPDGQRLFVAALGNNTLEVVDLAANQVVHSIGNLHEPQGAAFLKDRGLIAVANGGNGTCQFFDAKSYQLINTVELESDADNVRYDSANQRLYVGCGDGAIGIMDTKTLKHLADIRLSAHPESFQMETHGNRIFVNVPKAREIAVIDRQQNIILVAWPVTDANANFPMALDEAGHRLFIGCRNPAEVLVYDTESGRVSNRFSCVGDTDDLFYDDKTKRLYAAGGEGFITVYQAADNRYSLLTKIPTAAGARTALFVPTLSRLYLAVPHCNSQAAGIWIYEVVP
jgi:YVTN family beta-propeller protein